MMKTSFATQVSGTRELQAVCMRAPPLTLKFASAVNEAAKQKFPLLTVSLNFNSLLAAHATLHHLPHHSQQKMLIFMAPRVYFYWTDPSPSADCKPMCDESGLQQIIIKGVYCNAVLRRTAHALGHEPYFLRFKVTSTLIIANYDFAYIIMRVPLLHS
eukprot:6207788-Pleurochrysis_carterae.AAC.1